MTLRSLAALALPAALVLAGPASAQTLTADQVMRIHFKMNLPLNGTPNTLKLNFGLLTVNQAYGTRTALLWDCGKLLGTAQSSSFGTHVGRLNLDPSNSWTTPGSPWTFDSPGIADLTSVQNGTIIGIIDFTIASGSITLPLSQVNLSMIRATGPSSGSVVGPPPTITEIAIVPRLSGPAPGTTGQNNTYQVTGGTPNTVMWYGLGGACGQLPLPFAPPATYDVLPIAFAGVPSDGSGFSSLSLFAPAIISGVTVYAQCLEIVGGAANVSNVSAHTFP